MELVLCCHPVAHLSLWRIAGEFFRCPENDSRLASWMVTPATGRLEPLRGTPGGGELGLVYHIILAAEEVGFRQPHSWRQIEHICTGGCLCKLE